MEVARIKVRVLEEGKGTWSQMYRCFNCGSLLEVEAGDIRWDPEGLYYFLCGKCKERNLADSAGLPYSIKRKARAVTWE